VKRSTKQVLLVAVVGAAALFGLKAYSENLENLFRGPVFAKGGLYVGPLSPPLVSAAANGNKMTNVLGGSASITPGSITAPLCVDQATTITVTGAKVGDTCSLGPPAAETASTFCQCYVSAANVATVRCCAFVTGTPTSGTYYARTFSSQ